MKTQSRNSRRFLSLFLVLLILGITLIAGITPALAQTGSVTSTATPSDAAPTVGEQIDVSIYIDMTNAAAPDDELGSFTGTLNWNTAVLSYAGDSGMLGVFAGGYVNSNNAASGVITFNGANANGATGNIQLLTVTFDVVGAGTSLLELDYSAMAAAGTITDLLPVLTVIDGEVVASSGPTLSGGTGILALNFGLGEDGVWFPTGSSTSPFFEKDSSFNEDGTYEQVIPGDYNGDGLTDILAYNPGTEPDALWYATGTAGGPYFDKLPGFNEDGVYEQLIPGDFNGDNITDILAYNPGTGEDALWYGTGSTTGPYFDKQWAFNEDAVYEQMITGNFNSDNITDILAYNPGLGEDALWYGTGATSGPYFDKHWGFNEDGVYDQMITGNFNSDAITDILAYNPGVGEDALWYGTGATSGPYFDKQWAFNEDGVYEFMITGYFNSDAITDIVAFNPGVGEDALWYGTGATSGPYFDKQWAFNDDGVYDEMIAGDYNNDDITDILGFNQGTAADSIWYGTGNTGGPYFEKYGDNIDDGTYDVLIPGEYGPVISMAPVNLSNSLSIERDLKTE